MYVKLRCQTEEVPMRPSSRFQSFFSCNFPPKWCSFTTKSSVGILCHWSCDPCLSHQAVSDLPILQIPRICVRGWVGFAVPRASKTLSSVQLLSRVQLFATPWTAARQASLSITNSQSSPKLMPIESVMPSNHLTLCRPLLLPPSIFPSIMVFSSESVLRIRGSKYWSA